MSLMSGSGPFGAYGGRWNIQVSGGLWYWEDRPRRMRAMFAGETVLDTRRAKLLHESGTLPRLYFPLSDVRDDILIQSDQVSYDPHKGPVHHFDVEVGDRRVESAAVIYAEPPQGAPPLDSYVRVDFGVMDRWFEEDDPVYAHPRDPYHRVDVRSSSRHVKCDTEEKSSPSRGIRNCSSRVPIPSATTFRRPT